MSEYSTIQVFNHSSQTSYFFFTNQWLEHVQCAKAKNFWGDIQD